MEKFIPYEKLSKKEKRKIDQAPAADLGRLKPGHEIAHEQQGLQPKEITGMEAGITAGCL